MHRLSVILVIVVIASSSKSLSSSRFPPFNLREVLTHDAEYYGNYIAHGPTASIAQQVLQFTVASTAQDASVLLVASSLDVEAARRNVKVAKDTWIESEETAFTKSFYPAFKWRFDFSGKGYSSGTLFETSYTSPKQAPAWRPVCSFDVRYTVLEEFAIRALGVSSSSNGSTLPADGAAAATSKSQQQRATTCTILVQPQKENASGPATFTLILTNEEGRMTKSICINFPDRFPNSGLPLGLNPSQFGLLGGVAITGLGMAVLFYCFPPKVTAKKEEAEPEPTSSQGQNTVGDRERKVQ